MKNNFFRKILSLFITFFKIGAFTFGGGYAMLPLIEREVVENKKWISSEEVIDILAIAESTPGVISVNMATFVGAKIAGFWGAFFATLGVVLPSFVIISIISIFYIEYRDLEFISYAFYGIRAGVIVLILNAIKKLSKHTKLSVVTAIVFGITFLISTFTEINAVFIILAGIIFGVVYYALIKSSEVDK